MILLPLFINSSLERSGRNGSLDDHWFEGGRGRVRTRELLVGAPHVENILSAQ